MTLQEKFDCYLSGGENCPEASECEKIAEDFAIGFAKWLCDSEQTKELLEIYKKEKGL